MQNSRLPFQGLLGPGQLLRLPFNFERGVSPLRNVGENSQQARRIAVVRVVLGAHHHPAGFAAADDHAVFDGQNVARLVRFCQFTPDRLAILGMYRRHPPVHRGRQDFDRQNHVFRRRAGVIANMARFNIQLPDQELSVLQRQAQLAVARRQDRPGALHGAGQAAQFVVAVGNHGRRAAGGEL